MKLTAKQKKILEFINAFQELKGREPTQSEIALFFNVSQPAISKIKKSISLKLTLEKS